MTTFTNFNYTRPDLTAFETTFKKALAEFTAAGNPEQADSAMQRINRLRENFESMKNIADIRHTMNTEDPIYEAENDFFDEAEPLVAGFTSDYYKALIGSPHRTTLEQRWGRQLFSLAELQIKTFIPEIIEDLQAENRLSSDYEKLKASAKIRFGGQELNLTQMAAFAEDPDRSVRKRSKLAISAFYAEHDAEFGSIYYKLVQLRHRIAQQLGFSNFIELGYARLGRSDYDAAMVANYRKQIREDLVPVSAALRARQASRLSLPKLTFSDEDLAFLSGNATPKGDAAAILDNGVSMYHEMSAETGEFIDFMTGHQLMDLVTRAGKASGGYCAYIPDQEAPFIFSNFNGTSADVDVLTHEAGHAFQVYSSRHIKLPEYHWPTLEACEIHSMSMEYFAWPWMERFFGDDAQKYRFNHLSEALYFVPYGAAVDEFQHWVYENPSVSPAERKAAWRRIEQQYLPWRDYEDDHFLEAGGFWYRQGHIFQDPFYYIDYTLAQVCAFAFWGRARNKRETAWAAYLELCKQGGSQPFTSLLKIAGLDNPFESGTIKKTLVPIRQWLDEFDDSAL